jgi:predicted HicB family RNase H-like nuclease
LLLTRTLSDLIGFRFHYRQYLEICEEKGIEPKARAPDELQKKNKYVASKFIAAAAAAQDTDDAPHEVDRNQ